MTSAIICHDWKNTEDCYPTWNDVGDIEVMLRDGSTMTVSLQATELDDGSPLMEFHEKNGQLRSIYDAVKWRTL